VELPGAQSDLAANARKAGLSYDAKVKGIIDGLIIMPICCNAPAIPTYPNSTGAKGERIPAQGSLIQHVSRPVYVLLANTECAGLLSQALTAAKALLICDEHTCDHALVVIQDGDGYTLARQKCALNERRGLHTREGFDCCATYLRSYRQRTIRKSRGSKEGDLSLNFKSGFSA
jgi:hypothetical protein